MRSQVTFVICHGNPPSRLSRLLCAVVGVVGVGCMTSPDSTNSSEVEVSSRNVIGGGYFGLLTTEKYQYDWMPKHCVDPWYWPEQCYAWEMANGFGDRMQMGNHNTKLFASDLNPDDGAFLQEGADHLAARGADRVDVLFMQTHGGIDNEYTASYAMWRYPDSVYTSTMRLGDDGIGQKLFISWSCNTMWPDAYWWNRLGPLFGGGLKVMMGSHDLISWGYDMWYVTHDVAADIDLGNSLWYSWHHPNTYAAMDQDIAIAATGTTCDDCWDRLLYRNYDDLLYNVNYNMPVLQDGQIGCGCITWYDDLGG